MNNQDLLLQIVQTWRISETPEYRGFRCANCQEYKNKAWYHWINTDGYRLPIHLCDDTCEKAFRENRIKIDVTKKQMVDIERFGSSYTYSPTAIEKFERIITSWPEYKDPELKAFTCDECEKELDIDSNDGQKKGYHVWYKTIDNTLAELHFHKSCAENFGI